MILLEIIVMFIAAIITMYFIRKIIECLLNLSVLFNKKNYYDGTLRHESMVINKRTKKLEADQSLILPF